MPYRRIAATTALLTAESAADETATAAAATAAVTAAYLDEKDRDTQAFLQLIHTATALCKTFGDDGYLAGANAYTGTSDGKIFYPHCICMYSTSYSRNGREDKCRYLL